MVCFRLMLIYQGLVHGGGAVWLRLGVQRYPSACPLGPSLQWILTGPPSSTARCDSWVFSEPYLDKNKNVFEA